MPVKLHLRWAAASDTGRKRKHNEDRCYVDADRGIYAVIDGVGGHAAGETAASVAVEVIKERLERPSGTPEERLREAIALANNEIWRLAHTRPEWAGMACVLTVALVEDDVVTVGHVGDSRLYLLQPGVIQKITHDHSPIGEREDRGELTEEEAMKHSRRNEIFRDVGSSDKKPDETGFIDITSFPMPPDGALLLCTDGLTDLISSAEISAGVERYAPDYDAAIRALIDAANHAGGKDNVTVVLVAGPEFGPPARHNRNKTTTVRVRTSLRGPLIAVCSFLFGVALGLGALIVSKTIATSGPRTLTVGAAGINSALAQTHSGDTVVIPQGRYREKIEMREGVTIRAQQPGSVTLISPDGSPAVVARRIAAGTLEGVWIQGDLQAPLAAGIEIVDASPAISNVKITGAAVGILVRGSSSPSISSSQITNNLGAGIDIEKAANPHIESNLIAANGNGKPGGTKPGVETAEGAHPVLKDNGIVDNAAEPIWIHGRSYQPADFEENFFGGLPAKEAIRLITDWRPADSEEIAAPGRRAVETGRRTAETGR
jgi:parallel beta-helix repeat protein